MVGDASAPASVMAPDADLVAVFVPFKPRLMPAVARGQLDDVDQQGEIAERQDLDQSLGLGCRLGSDEVLSGVDDKIISGFIVVAEALNMALDSFAVRHGLVEDTTLKMRRPGWN